MHVIAQGQAISAEIVAPMYDATVLLADQIALKQQFDQQGYVYIKEFFPRADILAAREAIFNRLAEVGEIKQPVLDGVYSGTSLRKEKVGDLGQFWRSVSETWNLRRLSHGQQLHGLMDILLGTPSRVQDYIFLRPANRGKFTHIHCDYPFFTRATETVATAWIALGDVPLEQGPLFIIEGSHQFTDIVDSHKGFDISVDNKRKAAFSVHPEAFARGRNSRILTQDFAAGDIVVFDMFLLHGSLDNVSAENRVRLSCDVRYQAASAALDDRYFGTNPTGTTGVGYGELVGAKPLTEAWHVR